MGDSINRVKAIKEFLEEGPKSITEIAKKLKINWRTAENHLKLLGVLDIVIEKDIKNTRTFFLKAKENYFELPVKKKDQKKISTIYYYIKKFCKEKFKTDPTKTQAYKVIWKVDKKLKLGLPIGWYMYGPCCVQIYTNEEKPVIQLTNDELITIKETVAEYCLCDNINLQNKVYDEVNDLLYKTKVQLLQGSFENKEEINPLLMDLIKYSPKETTEVVTDFARSTLLVGWKITRECFVDYLWCYIALVKFKESLRSYFHDYIGLYLDNKIDEWKKEAQLHILDIIRCRSK